MDLDNDGEMTEILVTGHVMEALTFLSEDSPVDMQSIVRAAKWLESVFAKVDEIPERSLCPFVHGLCALICMSD
jgi:hypothetical protein